jgi:hypothetical protein
MNLLSGSTWKGAKLRFGEAKPDFKERCVNRSCLFHDLRLIRIYSSKRITLENKAAAEGPPPKKRRRTNEGSQAEDMSLVTSANANDRNGWQVSPLGRITRPVRMRPERPLVPETQQEELNPVLQKNQFRDVGTTEGKKKEKKNKRIKAPDSRARRRMIDMTKWGSVHLKGMFLDMPALGTKRLELDNVYDPTIESDDNEESGDDNDKMKVSQSSERTIQAPPSPSFPVNSIDIPTALPIFPIKSQPSIGQVPLALPNNSIDLEVEKTQSLNLLVSLFGGDDDNWVHPESVGSDIDVDELMKGDAILIDNEEDDGIEVVPIDSDMAGTTKLQNEEEENEQELEKPLASTKLSEHSTKLKDLFAPREEEGKCFQVFCN